MRPLRELISKEEASGRLRFASRLAEGSEVLPLHEALARVCASDVVAQVDVPPFRRALMDGYAVGGEAPLRVVGEAFAGEDPGPLLPGTAIRIATGAPLPEGATSVVRVEDTTQKDGLVVFPVKRPGPFFEPPGADVRRGDRILAVGDELTPARLGLAASVGLDKLEVLRRPRVEVRSSGDELLPPGAPPAPGRIYDANATTLRTLLAAAGGDVRVGEPLPDDEASLRAALRTDADLLVVSGGASAGDKDLLVDALRAEGEVLFHGVRVKPGKPLLAGRVGATLVVGLPGNPTSALSNAAIFVVPVLRRMAGLPDVASAVDATMATDVRGEPDRYLFLPVKVDAGEARPTFKGSSALTSLAGSDGWVGVPEGTSLWAGTRVKVHLW